MLNITKKQAKHYLLTTTLILTASFSVNAKLFTAYPGTYDASLMNVEAANIVNLYVEVSPGYPRNLRVMLQGIAVPVEYPKAPACHMELIQKSLNFTKEFMADAKRIEVKDIQMENTGQPDAVSNIYTKKGRLGTALTNEGLARPASTKTNKPWC